MHEAMQFDGVAKRVKGAFSTVRAFTTYAGLIPILGQVATAVGIGADVLQRSAERVDRGKRWYLIGPTMHKIALESALSSGFEEDQG